MARGRSIGDIVVTDGTAVCAHALALHTAHLPTRDLSDAVHVLCALHGEAPSIVEHARSAPGADLVQQWINDAAAAFDEERHALAALTAAIGPQPSTPGQAQTEAAIIAQRHAFATLARSERHGCALGAVLAFLLDWHAIRAVLDAAWQRAGSVPPPSTLPPPPAIIAVATRLSSEPGPARAMQFGAQQLIAQHRGLWHLLDARASARNTQ